MASEILRQSNFTGGELDPDMLGRRDLKAYFASTALATNLVPLPQGPLVRRPGLAFVDRLRNPLAFLTPPAGPVGAGSVSGGVGVASDAVVAYFDFGAPTAVGLIDLIDYAVVKPA